MGVVVDIEMADVAFYYGDFQFAVCGRKGGMALLPGAPPMSPLVSLQDSLDLHRLPLQESWYLKKKLALWAALWLIANWVLGCIFIPHNPVSNIDKVFYFGVSVSITLLLCPLV